MDREIFSFVKKVRRRLAFNIVINRIIVGGIIAFLVGMGILLLSFIVPIYNNIKISLIIISVIILIYAIISVFWFPSIKKSALIADSKGLKERLITSIELKNDNSHMSKMQKKDTVKHLRSYNIREKISFSIQYKKILALMIVILLFVGTGFIPNSMNDVARERKELKELQEEKIEELEDVLEKVEISETLTEEEKEEIKEMLEKAIEDIQEAESKEDIEKELDRMDKKLELDAQNKELEKKKEVIELRKDLNPESENVKNTIMQNDMQEMSEKLKEEQELENLSDSLDQKDIEKFQEALDELAKAMEEMSEEELEKLRELMEELAESMSSEEMSNIAQGLQDAMANGSLSQSSINSLAGQMDSIMNATQSLGVSSNSNQNENNNSGSGQGSGQGQGNGEGNGQGQGQGGQGGSGGQGGTGWNTGSKEGIYNPQNYEDAGEEIFIEGELGEDDNLVGKKTEGSDGQIIKSEDAIGRRGNSVDYNSVLGSYTSEAMSSIEEAQVPEGMKGVVKSYFELLNQ